jgi:hypothetical protein
MSPFMLNDVPLANVPRYDQQISGAGIPKHFKNTPPSHRLNLLYLHVIRI